MKVVDNLVYGLRYMEFNFQKGKIEFEPARKRKFSIDENLIFMEMKEKLEYTDHELEECKKEVYPLMMGYLRNEYVYCPHENQFAKISIIVPCKIEKKEDEIIVYDVLTREVLFRIDKEQEIERLAKKLKDYKTIETVPYPVP